MPKFDLNKVAKHFIEAPSRGLLLKNASIVQPILPNYFIAIPLENDRKLTFSRGVYIYEKLTRNRLVFTKSAIKIPEGR